MKADSEILSHVYERLTNDPLIDAGRITIGVADGVVTLQGVVPSLWQKVEAETRIQQIAGAFAIANELVVELPEEHEQNDGDIVRGAALVLSWHSDLPKTIHVSVSNAWLTLYGSARHHEQKIEAERAVRSITGVKGVVNDITISV